MDRSRDYTIQDYEIAADRKAKAAARDKRHPATPAHDEQLFERMGASVGAVTNALEARIKALEARDWGGTWMPGKSYAKSSIISHSGSAWIATREYPEGAPGMTNSGWKLFVKRGRDAKR